jgi:hypothetical protein
MRDARAAELGPPPRGELSHLTYRRLLTATALKLVFNALSFVERRQSGTFDSTDVYEHIFAATLTVQS